MNLHLTRGCSPPTLYVEFEDTAGGWGGRWNIMERDYTLCIGW